MTIRVSLDFYGNWIVFQTIKLCTLHSNQAPWRHGTCKFFSLFLGSFREIGQAFLFFPSRNSCKEACHRLATNQIRKGRGHARAAAHAIGKKTIACPLRLTAESSEHLYRSTAVNSRAAHQILDASRVVLLSFCNLSLPFLA